MRSESYWQEIDVQEPGPRGSGRLGGGARTRVTSGTDRSALLSLDEVLAPYGLGQGKVAETQDRYRAVVYELDHIGTGAPTVPRPKTARIYCCGCGTDELLPVRGWNEVRSAIKSVGWVFGPGGTLRETWCPQCRHTRENR